jgi:integrase
MTKWTPSKLSASERKIYTQGMKTNAPRDVALLSNFANFCSLNELPEGDLVNNLRLLDAQLQAKLLKASSRHTYLLRLGQLLITDNTVWRSLSAYLKSIQYTGRHEPVVRAPTIDEETLEIGISKLSNPFFRAIAEVMFITSIRCGDANDIKWREVAIGPTGVTLTLVGGKNRRCRRAREAIIMSNVAMSSFLKEWLATGKKRVAGDSNLFKVSTKMLTDALSQALGRKVTTYSIRNMRIRSFIAQATNDRGETNWTKVKNRSLHNCERTVRGFYNH